MRKSSSTVPPNGRAPRLPAHTPPVDVAVPKRREILKIGVAITEMGRLLVVRKKGSPSYILPGGKPEKGEDDIRALGREIEEELGCKLDPHTVAFLGSFTDTAADMHDTTVTVRLYAAHLIGNPSPQAEIENLKWYSPSTDVCCLAPSLQNQIVPFLREQGRLMTTP